MYHRSEFSQEPLKEASFPFSAGEVQNNKAPLSLGFRTLLWTLFGPCLVQVW